MTPVENIIRAVGLLMLCGVGIATMIQLNYNYGCHMRVCAGGDDMVICLTSEDSKRQCDMDNPVPADTCHQFLPYSSYGDSLKCKHGSSYYNSERKKTFATTPHIGSHALLIIFIGAVVVFGAGGAGLTMFFENIRQVRCECIPGWWTRYTDRHHTRVPTSVPMSDV
jgi:hypothetical protein